MTGSELFDWAYPTAFALGSALSICGAALQSVLRNPLAEPYILGTVGGASLFSATAVVTGIAALGSAAMSAAAFAGAFFSLALVVAVSCLSDRIRRSSCADSFFRSSGSTVVLAGFVVGSFTGSLQMFAVSFADSDEFTALSKWLYGSIENCGGETAALASAMAAGTFLALWAAAKRMNVIELGRTEAECLGINAGRTILSVLSVVAVSTAISVSIAGAIGFIGLVVPHAVRRMTGARMQRILPASAFAGGVALMLAESAARILPGNIPAGVICAVFGAPFFLLQLVSGRNGEGRDI